MFIFDFNKSELIDYFYNEIGYIEFIIKRCGNVVSDDMFNYCLNRKKWLSFMLNDNYIEAYRFYLALNQRRNKLYKTLKTMAVKDDLIFLTLTFNNDFISLSERTLYLYVQRFLNSLNVKYVANKDYGEKNNRLHYHAVVSTDNIDLSLWIYGSINVQRVKMNKDDLSRVANYIIKFVNHSFKDSTNKYVIYSRKRSVKK